MLGQTVQLLQLLGQAALDETALVVGEPGGQQLAIAPHIGFTGKGFAGETQPCRRPHPAGSPTWRMVGRSSIRLHIGPGHDTHRGAAARPRRSARPSPA